MHSTWGYRNIAVLAAVPAKGLDGALWGGRVRLYGRATPVKASVQ